MTRAEWIALAKRCEKATGPNYALEQDIALAGSFGDSVVKPPAVTASLDAIVAMIERELPDPMWRVLKDWGDMSFAYVNIDKFMGEAPGIGWNAQATTPALALCAAFCKAMSERVDE